MVSTSAQPPPGPGTVRDLLPGRSLVVVTNREPYVHSTLIERPTGGLVAALDPVMQETGGLWVAWGSGEADFDVVDERGCVQVPPEAPRYTLRRLRLSRREVERFYHGYANQSLWPLFHMAMDKARFARRYWAAYQMVNHRFAETTFEMLGQNPVVWIHDYHLALCPRYLRELKPDLFIMQFWHIPWPAWDVYRMCPQSAELIEGLLANDLLGFHLPRHVANFMDCAAHELGAEVDRQQGFIRHGGRCTLVRAFPISIDVGAWGRIASSRDCERWMARLRRRLRLDDRQVCLGVDRLDYTKGILERLRAIELLLQRVPELRDRFVYVQKAAPSRTRILAYRQLQQQVEAEITRINAVYGTPHWQPIVYIPRPIPVVGMAALYRLADVCLVTSLQDGMNLVGKEFVASQQDERGVLVLSSLAGAIEASPWSIAINPYDTEGVAEAVRQALSMPEQERRQRMVQMRSHLARHDIYHWMEQSFRAAARLLDTQERTHWVFADLEPIRNAVAGRDHLAVLLDFDGTLAEIADRPDDVQLDPRLRGLLERLGHNPRVLVAVISGRTLEDIRRRVGLEHILYAGNHGLELAGPGWRVARDDAVEARGLVAACCDRLSLRLRDVRDALVENKGLSASVHFRLVPRGEIETVRRIVLEELGRVPPGRLEARQGKMVLEILPVLDWDKGRAARWLLEHALGDGWEARCTVVYAGDDSTDEDAFVALAGTGITVRVTQYPQPTAARYLVRTVGEVGRLLEALAGWMPAST